MCHVSCVTPGLDTAEFHNNCYCHWGTLQSLSGSQDMTMCPSLLLLLALQFVVTSSFSQTDFQLGGAEGSNSVEDFISAVNGFEQMKYSGGGDTLNIEPLRPTPVGESNGGNKRKKMRRIRKKKKSTLKRNKNIIKVNENDTVNLNRQKDILVSNQEKRKISKFISKVCNTSKSEDVIGFCYKRRRKSVRRPQSLLSAIFSIFSN